MKSWPTCSMRRRCGAVDPRGRAGSRRPPRRDRLSRPRRGRGDLSRQLIGTLTLLEALVRVGRRPQRRRAAEHRHGLRAQRESARARGERAARARHALRGQQARDGAHGAAVRASAADRRSCGRSTTPGRASASRIWCPKIVRHFAQRAAVIELGNVDVVARFPRRAHVVDAYRRLLAAPRRAGETFNLCSGRRHVALRDIVAHARGRSRATGSRSASIRSSCGRASRAASSARRRSCGRSIGDLPDLPLAATLADMLREQEALTPNS